MARAIVREATVADLEFLVRHRRGMWGEIADIPNKDLDAADRVYRRWALARMQAGRFVGFIVDIGSKPIASGCVWLMDVQPRPNWNRTTAAYLLSMFTEPRHRGEGHATRIVRAAIRWTKARDVPVMLLHASRFGDPIYKRLGFERTTEMQLFLVGKKRCRDSSARKASRRASR